MLAQIREAYQHIYVVFKNSPQFELDPLKVVLENLALFKNKRVATIICGSNVALWDLNKYF